MEHPDRYHQLFSANLRERAKRAVSRFIFGDVDISPNEVNKAPEPINTQAEQAVYASLQRRLDMDIDDLRWEAQAETWDEGNK